MDRTCGRTVQLPCPYFIHTSSLRFYLSLSALYILFHTPEINGMDKLTSEQQAELKKLSSERIRAKLVKAGYDEEAVFSFDRQMLLETLAEYTLRPAETKVSEAEIRQRELEMRERELKVREAEIQAQKQQRDDEIKLRMAELEAQKQQREAEIQAQKQQHEDEMKLRMSELEAQRLQRDAGMDLKKAELKAES